MKLALKDNKQEEIGEVQRQDQQQQPEVNEVEASLPQYHEVVNLQEQDRRKNSSELIIFSTNVLSCDLFVQKRSVNKRKWI